MTTDYTSPDFWAKAPEGATHWEHEGPTYTAGWMRFDKDGWWYWREGGECWELYRIDLHQRRIAAMIPRPTPWNGTGLPPVGTVCEAIWNEASDTWLKVKVFGANEHGQPIFRWEEGPKIYEYQASPLHGPHGTAYFRPIRTPEQIAADQRKRAIDAMQRIVSSGDPHYDRKVCETLYDAGYRKLAQEAAK